MGAPLRDELLEASLATAVGSVIAADFVVEDTRHLALQIEIKIELHLASRRSIAPDRRRRRL
jgi:hypothetical protein